MSNPERAVRMLPTTKNTWQEGLYVSEHNGTVECSRVVNIAETYIESVSIKLLNGLQYYQAVYNPVVRRNGTRGVMNG